MSSVINKTCLKLQFHDIYKILFWGPKIQNIIPPLLTHILVSKHKILFLQEDLPPITGDPGSCNRMIILPRGRNYVFLQEDFFRRNFILGPEDYFSECRIFQSEASVYSEQLCVRLHNFVLTSLVAQILREIFIKNFQIKNKKRYNIFKILSTTSHKGNTQIIHFSTHHPP